MLPNFIIIGAGKCGTSALYYYLHHHPEVQMSRVKELRFFNGEKWNQGLGWYESNWDGSSAPVRGEASPGYTTYPEPSDTATRMHDVIPDAKLIYLVRDPIERVISSYINAYAQGHEPRGPDEALQPSRDDFRVQASMYALQLEQYLAHYPIERILVLGQDELLNERRGALREVFRFLGVDERFESPTFDELRNESSEKRRMRWKSRLLPRSLMPKPGVHRFEWETRAKVKRAVFGPLSRQVERPTLTAEQRRGYEEILGPEAERLREFTGKPFADWSV